MHNPPILHELIRSLEQRSVPVLVLPPPRRGLWLLLLVVAEVHHVHRLAQHPLLLLLPLLDAALDQALLLADALEGARDDGDEEAQEKKGVEASDEDDIDVRQAGAEGLTLKHPRENVGAPAARRQLKDRDHGPPYVVKVRKAVGGVAEVFVALLSDPVVVLVPAEIVNLAVVVVAIRVNRVAVSVDFLRIRRPRTGHDLTPPLEREPAGYLHLPPRILDEWTPVAYVKRV
mmetsp:Transcript_21887/g.50819  ORF Transcript_21887/g.50819 Transcript_21887/m.50819 type:complete len:231 (+) Transcript_21887:1724-2416(+)